MADANRKKELLQVSPGHCTLHPAPPAPLSRNPNAVDQHREDNHGRERQRRAPAQHPRVQHGHHPRFCQRARLRRRAQVTLYPAPYTLHPKPCTLHPAPYTLRPTPCTLHPTPYTLHRAPSTLHPQPSNLHPQPLTLHPQPSTLHPQPSTLRLSSAGRCGQGWEVSRGSSPCGAPARSVACTRHSLRCFSRRPSSCNSPRSLHTPSST